MPDIPTSSSDAFRNRPAALARLFATVSLIPGVAIVAGPLAVYFGILGLRVNRRNPTYHGHRSSWIGIGAGALLFVICASFAIRVCSVSWEEYRRLHPATPVQEKSTHGHE